MLPTLKVKVQNLRKGSLNEAFEALGLQTSEVYSRKYTRANGHKSTFRNRNPEVDFIKWAESLYHDEALKFHPDKHQTRKEFYTEKMAVLNAALARVRHIERRRR